MQASSRPPWLRVKLPGDGQYYEVRKKLGRLGLHTVCEAARCPNAAECWGDGTATFMILGEVCTRACRFCAVSSGRPKDPPSADEPERMAEAIAILGLRYTVVTSVDRDDLEDGGAAHFVRTVQAIARRSPEILVELLTPDFTGDPQALRAVARSGAHVLGHNVETPRERTASVRDRRCSYDLSLRVLQAFRAESSSSLLKSSLLLGLGETDDQVLGCLRDLRAIGTDWVTLGQYLRPTRKHVEVSRFVEPDHFTRLGEQARELGFPLVTAGPLVRSSYKAAEAYAAALLRERGNDQNC
jgi:lipoyl synthase